MINKMNEGEGKKLVEAWLEQAIEHEVEVDSIHEGENILLMYFNTKEFLKTGDIYRSLLGSNLVFIDRNDGEIVLAPHEEELYDFLLDFKIRKNYPTDTALMRSILEKVNKG